LPDGCIQGTLLSNLIYRVLTVLIAIGALSVVSSLSYAIQVENPPLPDETPVYTQEDTAPDLQSEVFAEPEVLAYEAKTASAPVVLVLETPDPAAPLELVPQQIPSIVEKVEQETAVGVPTIPFYSQFNDISAPEWKKIGCGVTSLAMIIEYYKPHEITVDGLLQEGIASGAYLNSAGWIHQGMVDLAKDHGLDGRGRDLSSLSKDAAFEELKKSLDKSPVIASVYYTFTPGHPIPHLVVVSGVEGDVVYYNDPAEETGGGTISVEKFKAAWKKRYIEIYP
jgi:predicted double-glycine peptidase